MTWLVGFGVCIGVPVVLGLAFVIGNQEPWLLLFPLPLILAFGITYLFRPVGFVVSSREVGILRPIGSRKIRLKTLQQLRAPAAFPTGLTIGLFRSQGFFGTYGTFWNRHWGKFSVYVTNQANLVELLLANGSRVIVSPDEPQDFVRTVCNAARAEGLDIQVN